MARRQTSSAWIEPLPDNGIDLGHFRVTRRDWIGGILHEYHLIA